MKTSVLRNSSIVLALTFIMLLAGCESKVTNITIIHHNDFHAANLPYQVIFDSGDTLTIQGIAGLSGLAKAVRDTAQPSLWLYAGDEYTGTPISSMTQGASQIQICRRLDIDVAVLGNHEFDYGIERAKAFSDSLGIPILGGANLVDETGKPFALTHYDTTVGSVPIRIIGLVPPDLNMLTSTGATGNLKILPQSEAVRKFLPEKDRLVIVLSHMGLRADTVLARKVPEIDVVVGGHWHTVLHTPLFIGKDGRLPDSLIIGDGRNAIPGCLVLQAGARGRYLGVLSISVKDGDIVSASGQLLLNDGTLTRRDSALYDFVDALENSYTQSLDDVIATLTEPLYNRPYGEETSMGRWVTDAFRRSVGADVAFQNPGGLRKTIDAGDVRIRDIWEASPFGNTMVIFELTGSELQQVMNHLADKPREPLLVSGLQVELDLKAKLAKDLRVAGTPIDPDRKYKAITLSYIIDHFEKYFGIPLADRMTYDTGIIDRDMLIEAARAEKVIIPPTDRRIVYLNR